MSIVRNALAMIRREQSKLGMVPPEKLAKYLNMGMDASRREISLIETLLSATKVDASRLQFHFKKVSISKGIEDAMVAQRGAIAEKGLQLVYEPPALDIALFVDQTRFQEIIDNFLSNAIKYTPTGNITIKIWQDADWGWLGIRDTGMGMDYEDLKNLGKKFFRAKQYIEKTTAGPKIVRAGGTGLGLFVTFELIRLMGGVLYVNSAVNQGTLFTIGFPLYKNQKDLHIDQSFGEITPQNRRHIVLNGNPPRHPEDMVS
jgi:signal transduction histidine kinase